MSRVLHQLALRQAVLPYFAQPRRHMFYEPYKSPPKPDPDGPVKNVIDGWKVAKKEFRKLIDEWKEKIHLDHPRYFLGDVVPQYNFREQKDRDKFQVFADSDYNLGFSKGEFVATRAPTGLFRGYLDTRVPRDGKTQQAGYIGIQGQPDTRSFFREKYLDWAGFTHLVIRCRGDGRHYLINLHAFDDLDLTWFFNYTFPLYTRGGPYWQITSIPFSKFFVAYKGSIQDKQERPTLNCIRKISIVLMDKTPGPFQLEIDYIALGVSRKDEDEESAWETYETSNNYSTAYGMK